jgi:hypothetical protein
MYYYLCTTTQCTLLVAPVLPGWVGGRNSSCVYGNTAAMPGIVVRINTTIYYIHTYIHVHVCMIGSARKSTNIEDIFPQD